MIIPTDVVTTELFYVLISSTKYEVSWNDADVGVTGTSNTGIGIRGTSNNIGVRGDGDGFGVVGVSTIGTGVAGTGGSIGVRGDGSDAGVFGNGVNYGGAFIGGLAPLRLQPLILVHTIWEYCTSTIGQNVYHWFILLKDGRLRMMLTRETFSTQLQVVIMYITVFVFMNKVLYYIISKILKCLYVR